MSGKTLNAIANACDLSSGDVIKRHLAGLGIVTTILGSLRARRKWKGVSDELLYARARLEQSQLLHCHF